MKRRFGPATLVAAVVLLLPPAGMSGDSSLADAPSRFATLDEHRIHYKSIGNGYVRKLSPTAEFRVMDGVGHFLMLEKPEESNAMLAAFLAKQRG